MDDSISRKWLMECVTEGWIKFDTEKDENKFIHLVRDVAPPAQPEIIYCGECKYMMPNGQCMEFADDSVRVSASAFCSYAERGDE